MRNVVINDIGHESDFKPLKLINEYIIKTENDFREENRVQNNKLNNRCCPACNSGEQEYLFSKFGFSYVRCKNCRSVFLNPSPDDTKIKDHYLNSSSSTYWQESLAGKTKKMRIQKIYGPELEWILSNCGDINPNERKLGLFNLKSSILADFLMNEQNFAEKSLINSYFNTKRFGEKNLAENTFCSVEDFKDSGKKINIVCLFDVLDSLNDIDTFFSSLNAILEKEAIVFLTTISISGFDLQILKGNSRNIFPPDRLNALSRKGLNTLFDRHGFRQLEYSTPGILDFNNVEEEYRTNPDSDIPDFVKEMIEKNDPHLKRDFQNFLQTNKLSSFVRVVLEKKD